MRSGRVRPAVLLLAPALVLGLSACTTGSTYWLDRARDLSDVVDLKYGQAYGLGAKLEATIFLGAGAGMGLMRHTTEEFGRRDLRSGDTRVVIRSDKTGTMRRETQTGDTLFMHMVVCGMDGVSADRHLSFSGTTGSMDLLGINVSAFIGATPPLAVDCFRMGGEVLLPFVQGGAYLSLGQLADFFGGFFGLDPGRDDGEVQEVRGYVSAHSEDSMPVSAAPALHLRAERGTLSLVG